MLDSDNSSTRIHEILCKYTSYQLISTFFSVICSAFPVGSFCVYLACTCMHAQSLQLCPTLCNPMDCNPSGSSVHGILQARILEWVAVLFSRGSSQPRDWIWVSCTAGRLFTVWATREAHSKQLLYNIHFSLPVTIYFKNEMFSLYLSRESHVEIGPKGFFFSNFYGTQT